MIPIKLLGARVGLLETQAENSINGLAQAAIGRYRYNVPTWYLCGPAWYNRKLGTVNVPSWRSQFGLLFLTVGPRQTAASLLQPLVKSTPIRCEPNARTTPNDLGDTTNHGLTQSWTVLNACPNFGRWAHWRNRRSVVLCRILTLTNSHQQSRRRSLLSLTSWEKSQILRI